MIRSMCAGGRSGWLRFTLTTTTATTTTTTTTNNNNNLSASSLSKPKAPWGWKVLEASRPWALLSMQLLPCYLHKLTEVRLSCNHMNETFLKYR